MKNLRNTRIAIQHFKQCLLVVLLSIFTGLTAFGQGFYKIITVQSGISTIAPERILCLPGGEFGLPMHDVDHAPIAWARADDNGNTLFSKHRQLSFSQVQCFVVTNDGNYLVVDTTFNLAAPGEHLTKLTWYDFNGLVLQTKTYEIDPLRGYNGSGKIISDDLGNFYFSGLYTNASNDLMLYMVKFDAIGNILWQSSLVNAFPDGGSSINAVVLTKDYNLLMDYSTIFSGRRLLYKNLSNNQEWEMPVTPIIQYSLSGDDLGGAMFCSNGNISYNNPLQSLSWTKNLGTLLNDPNVTYANFSMPVTGGWVFVSTNQDNVLIFKLDADGNLLWVRSNPALPFGFASCSAGKELPDESLVFGGNAFEMPFLLKLSPDGNLFPNKITGSVVNDLNNNCLADPGDTPAQGRIVTAQRQSDGIQLVGMADANGNYEINGVDTGSYVVKVTPYSYQWQVCGTPDTVSFTTANQPATGIADFELQVLYECPQLWVSVSTDQLRVCHDEQYVLHYCNSGTQEATDAFVELTLPAEFTLVSSSSPYTLVAPDKLHFEVGNIPIDSCGTIYIDVSVACDPELFDQTLCVTASIYPDTTCFPQFGPWSGASIQVAGHCDADSVRFEIFNGGPGDMPTSLNFIIVEDHVISLQGQYALPAGGSRILSLPKDGSTWRIQADQEPNHPLGTEPVSVAVEGCVENGASFSTGMVNLFPNSFSTLTSDMDCHQVLNGFDPNEKLAFPIGVHNEHFIEANTSIKYQINFQNTGNASTTNVLLKDTLSALLDISTLRMGAASHPYSWSLSGNGILQVRFDNINLPDSNSNEAASHGFVQFKLLQQKDNPPGTVIENQAGIYFDSNPVVITNNVWHTIGENFLEVVAVSTPNGHPVAVSIIPNPVTETALIKFDNTEDLVQHFMLFDNSGKQVRTQEFTGGELLFKRDGLAAGVYYFNIVGRDGRQMVSGKLILR